MEFVLVSVETWGGSLDIHSAQSSPTALYLAGTEYLVGTLVAVEDDTVLVDKGSYFREEVGSMHTSQMHQHTMVVVGGSMGEEGMDAVDMPRRVEGQDTW
jgi:hypothetical protein